MPGGGWGGCGGSGGSGGDGWLLRWCFAAPAGIVDEFINPGLARAAFRAEIAAECKLATPGRLAAPDR